MKLPLPEAGGERGRRVTFFVCIVLLCVTVVLCIVGLRNDPLPECTHVVRVVDRIYMFFFVKGFHGDWLKIRECFDSPALQVARFTGPASVLAGFLALVWQWLQQQVAAIRRSCLSSHFVIVGYGSRGQMLARTVSCDSKVLAVDAEPLELARPPRCAWLTGDGRDEKTLRQARVKQARYTFVATGDDLQNLQIARSASKLGCPDVYALVGETFARRLGDNDEFVSINAISLEEMAARSLSQEARFHELAELQGHPRAHLVVAGDGPLAVAIIAQVVRTAITSRLADPVITVLAPSAVQSRNRFLRGHPGLALACDFAVLELDCENDVLDRPDVFADLRGRGPVAAIVVTHAQTGQAFLIASALRSALRHRSMVPAPVFFAASPLAAAEPFAARLDHTPRLSDVMHPFETGVGLCTPDNIARIDAAAQRIHEAYLGAHRRLSQGAPAPSDARSALQPWHDLAPTYRRANRRVADHVPAKLASAGCFVPPGPVKCAGDLDILAGGRLEQLAELEHRAWMADRHLNGWRSGEHRDERARLHECLVPYDQLQEATKELDRAQVRELADTGLQRGAAATSTDPGLTRPDLWVGVIGTLDVRESDVEWMRATACAQLDAIMATVPGTHLTFVSPLAPGTDLILTRLLVAHANSRGWPHRLVVPEALAADRVIADFRTRWENGSPGDVGMKTHIWRDVAAALVSARAELVVGVPNSRIIEADLPDKAHAAAYRWQNAYIVRSCEVLLAAVRTQAGEPLAGGTAEAVNWHRDPSRVPPEFATMPSRFLRLQPRTLVLELESRTLA